MLFIGPDELLSVGSLKGGERPAPTFIGNIFFFYDVTVNEMIDQRPDYAHNNPVEASPLGGINAINPTLSARFPYQN